MRGKREKKLHQEINLKLCSQIDFIRLIKNANDHKSLEELVLKKEDLLLNNFSKKTDSY
ncbi:MAG TPA: hypothetical protein PK894_05670 [Defluviitoga sp.]|nr:hypothetical protein [Defluviitoga sp.]HOP25080.1 hypothetical protein [Defluviitoga sp.]HPZ29133.1 hypothetical protein [Defluviitoga sp.]HQD63063.1 hypothetical protein [Defluviitoga sp.]